MSLTTKIMYYGVKSFHTVWSNLSICSPILFHYLNFDFWPFNGLYKYRKILIIPPLTTLTSYIILNRKCCLMMLEDYIQNGSLTHNDKHYTVYHSTFGIVIVSLGLSLFNYKFNTKENLDCENYILGVNCLILCSGLLLNRIEYKHDIS